MSDQINDGGPAFPLDPDTNHLTEAQGMSLRDYFAAQASQGAADVLCDMLQPDDPTQTWDPVPRLEAAARHATEHARVAYIYADAMLRAREAK